ncbi:type I-E CRISPR-associated protein Cas6/Cse3/CasE [Micromonospora peucetia]|uniref:CRISPR-associated protein, Cse3 family n=1 Tax=Micromonospora peucetia TaxID=47871 RepID=A0A1C6TVD1_9ACTN|nr:type I-E CRISPR-associated protein Cas6/Cse3/CasE [Micromonospora peucetia]SCL45744.1 CRISPR-associated protein, Cse3 family [Micromonospora peucetia]
MPYLSRLHLNPLRTQTQRMLRNPQVLHAAVLGGLSRQPVTERVLWRLDPPHQHRLTLLVLTGSRPSWEHLIEQAGWPGADEPQTLVKPYEPLLDQVQRGRIFAFRLKANPTSATKKPAAPSEAQARHLAGPRPRGVRVAHRKLPDQLDWLIARLRQSGCSVLTDTIAGTEMPAVQVTDRHRLRFHKTGGSRSDTPPVTLESATFDGMLRIDEPETARQTLLEGIGSAKAYGFGLLTLAPPHPRTAS